MAELHRVVIIGGGFAGLTAARGLRRAPVEITLIDRRNFHLFQPLLYQVATGGLSPANIASPLRAILRRQKNVQVVLGEVTGFDVAGRAVLLRDGELRSQFSEEDQTERRVAYDTLIVAAGVGHNYFGHPEWERHAPGLKTLEEATDIRRRILLAFEAAEREPDPGKRHEWMTFVIIGAGPTGMELAGALAEIARAMRHEFRRIRPTEAQILLVEGTDRALGAFPLDLSAAAEVALQRLGVQLLTNTFVTRVGADGVAVKTGETEREIAARTVVWAAGVRASPLGKLLAESAGAELDGMGRVVVEPDLTLKGHSEIFVLGDLAHCKDANGNPLPGLAPVAQQQGRYAARLVRGRLRGRGTTPFRYHDYGTMATIGRAAAVADFGAVRFDGYPAWLAWLFIHLMQLVGYQNRLLVFVQWAWNYFTWNRSARLITNPSGEGLHGRR